MYKKINIKDFRLFQDQTLVFGKYLTVLSGRNSTGKSTILGMVANSGELKKKDGVTYAQKPFRAEFSELFKGSRDFDKIGPNRFEIILCNEYGSETDRRSFRTAWQAKDNRKKTIEERFRVIPYKKLEGGKKTEAKFNYPVIYLGLSRLFPIGESKNESIKPTHIAFKSEEHHNWFIQEYMNILSLHSDVKEIINYSIGETDKKSGIGISTDKYDYLTNSSGEDNLGQILLALLSFKNLKEEQGSLWQGGILLIDEIDATLHPAAQNKLIDLFIREARRLQIQIIVTTHSISILQYICEKTLHNTCDENKNNDIELYYLTNANRKLEITRNEPFKNIKSDLLIFSSVQSENKIKLYSEDAEARWFLRYLVKEYLTYVELLDITIGCSQLLTLFSEDVSYFSNTLIVLDGDAPQKQLNNIKSAMKNVDNVLLLPYDKMNPEQVVYNYLISLESKHEYWSSKAAHSLGFTWDYFREHGPKSGDYKKRKDREKYKCWFKMHQVGFENTKLMDYWIQDNDDLVQEFKDKFRTAYNKIAQKNMAMPIDD